MSDLRVTAQCEDCGYWISGTSTLDWLAEHLDIYPDHRVRVTKSGVLTSTRSGPDAGATQKGDDQ